MHAQPLPQSRANPRRASRARRRRAVCLASLIWGLSALASPAAADRFRQGMRAFEAGNFQAAAALFTDLASRGDPRAQTYLGYMFFNGVGVPQNYLIAAGWYRCASQHGVARAQFQLGLMYDKGQGVPQDYIIAYSLLNLAVAGAGPERENWVLIRDAVGSKLSLVERLKAQEMAFEAPPSGPCLPIETGH